MKAKAKKRRKLVGDVKPDHSADWKSLPTSNNARRFWRRPLLLPIGVDSFLTTDGILAPIDNDGVVVIGPVEEAPRPGRIINVDAAGKVGKVRVGKRLERRLRVLAESRLDEKSDDPVGAMCASLWEFNRVF